MPIDPPNRSADVAASSPVHAGQHSPHRMARMDGLDRQMSDFDAAIAR